MPPCWLVPEVSVPVEGYGVPGKTSSSEDLDRTGGPTFRAAKREKFVLPAVKKPRNGLCCMFQDLSRARLANPQRAHLLSWAS
jgi:hypothetical protein